MTLNVCGILVSRRLKSPQKLLFFPPPFSSFSSHHTHHLYNQRSVLYFRSPPPKKSTRQGCRESRFHPSHPSRGSLIASITTANAHRPRARNPSPLLLPTLLSFLLRKDFQKALKKRPSYCCTPRAPGDCDESLWNILGFASQLVARYTTCFNNFLSR